MSAEGELYRGRLAPTPSGYLHAGHARTFAAAWRRAREAGGILVYRTEDIDRERCRPEFESAAEEDLAWLGLEWDEGGGRPGDCGPYRQSERFDQYAAARRRLRERGAIYPAPFSRRRIAEAAERREADGSWQFPAFFRPEAGAVSEEDDAFAHWRFRVPDGEEICFVDGRSGEHRYICGRDFGDFLVWRKDGSPSYELAVVVDDAAMGITEVVRGEDLLLSTARQILVYRALGLVPPAFRHEPLVRDAAGRRLSKTAGSLAIREMRNRGLSRTEILCWEP